MSDPVSEALFLLLLFLGGALLGHLLRHGPLSPGLALVLPLSLAPLGLWLTMTFC
jgi:hypothetical protein